MPRSKEPLTLEYALLGFIQGEPAHAYEIHQRLEQTEMLGLVWRLKQRQLYALLERLEAEGYLDAAIENQENRPQRRILHLTAKGSAAFDDWLNTPVEHGRDFRQEFMAKLYFARRQGSSILSTLIEQQRTVCQQRCDDFHKQLQKIHSERVLDSLVVQFRLGQMKAIVEWLDSCTTMLGLPPNHLL